MGPVRHRFKQSVDHRFGEIQGFRLVLLEVAGDDVVLSEPRAAFIWGLDPHHQAQQGGFAGAIGAHKGDPVAALHFQFRAKKQDLVAVGVGEVVESGHLAA